MIHHVSIPAREPQHVAEVLAELMGGKCYPFGPLEGAFSAAERSGPTLKKPGRVSPCRTFVLGKGPAVFHPTARSTRRRKSSH